MLPYIELHIIPLGFINVQVWGLLVAMGLLFGTYVAAWRGKAEGYDKHVWELAPRAFIAAFLGARVFHVVFYDLGHYLANPLDAINPFLPGFSIIGGLLAAALAFYLYQKKFKLPFLRFADVCIFGVPFGFWIGRLGCFLIHDHPGIETGFFLGLRFPDGIIRHDLGLYESLTGLVMSVIFLVLARKPRSDGFYLYAFMALYGIARVWLDFYRLADARYWLFTPTQWLAAVAAAVGIYLLTATRKKSIVA